MEIRQVQKTSTILLFSNKNKKSEIQCNSMSLSLFNEPKTEVHFYFPFSLK